MENLSTEATYALVISISALITSFAGWIKVVSNSKARESTTKAEAEAVKLEFQRQLLANNKHFQQEIDELKTENTARENAHLEDKRQWEASNKKLSDELREQLEGQARERAEVRQQTSEYQELVRKQGLQLEAQNHAIAELQTQVAGFKALSDELKQDRNRLAAELEKTKRERDAAVQISVEKDALIQQFDERIKALENAITERDAQIQRLTKQVEELSFQNRLEDVPTEPKPAGLSEALKTGDIIEVHFTAETLPPEGAA